MQHFSPIKQRILETIANKGLSKYEFYAKTGITRGVLDKDTGISEDNIAKFIAYFDDIDINWLITGNGGMLKNSTDPGKLISIDENNAGYLKKHGIPLIPIEAMAGIGGNGDMQIAENEIQNYFIVPQLDGIADCAFTVAGDSMAFTYLRGDYVLCKRIHLGADFIQWNKAYVLDTAQGNLVKRVKQGPKKDVFTLISDNLQFEPFDMPFNRIRAMAIILGLVRLE